MEERSYQKGTTLSQDGVTVHQLLTEEEFGVPAVIIKLVSKRDDRANVELSVHDLLVDRIGFHPDFENESWSVEDETLVFETDLPPGKELITLYAIEDEDAGVLETAIDNLEVDSVESLGPPEEPVLGEAGAIDEEIGDAGVKPPDGPRPKDDDLIDLETDPGEALLDAEVTDEATIEAEAVDQSATNAADQLAGDTDDDPESTLIDLDEPVADENEAVGTPPARQASDEHDKSVEFEAVTDDQSGTDSQHEGGKSAEDDASDGGTKSMDQLKEDYRTSGAGEGGDAGELSTGALIDELIERVQSDTLSPDERRRLQAVDIDAERGREDVHDAQISHLQARVSDVETFTESIETMIERHGRPGDAFDDFQSRLQEFEREFEEVQSETTRMAEEVEGVGPRLEAVLEEVESVTEELAEVRKTVDTVGEEQEAVQSDVRELQTWRKKVTGALEAFMGE